MSKSIKNKKEHMLATVYGVAYLSNERESAHFSSVFHICFPVE